MLKYTQFSLKYNKIYLKYWVQVFLEFTLSKNKPKKTQLHHTNEEIQYFTHNTAR